MDDEQRRAAKARLVAGMLQGQSWQDAVIASGLDLWRSGADRLTQCVHVGRGGLTGRPARACGQDARAGAARAGRVVPGRARSTQPHRPGGAARALWPACQHHPSQPRPRGSGEWEPRGGWGKK